MKRHSTHQMIRPSQPHRTTNDFFLSPSLHHIHQRKRTDLANGSRSSSTTAFPRIRLSSVCSSSQTSLNGQQKEVDLSEQDFCELRNALQTVFACTRPEVRRDWQQRLTSPYLQSRSNNHNRFSSPLYTDEYFIRNGLWNHNDGPEMQEMWVQKRKFCHRSTPRLPSSASSLVLKSPLALVPNQKYLLTAMTSNFAVDDGRGSQSAMDVSLIKGGKGEGDDEQTETNSIRVRRKKVQAWERENLLPHSKSTTSSTERGNEQADVSDHPDRSSGDQSVRFIHKSQVSSPVCTSAAPELASVNQNVDHLFPMVKVLAPYIILRDVMYSKARKGQTIAGTSSNADGKNNQRSMLTEKGLIRGTEKRPYRDMAHSSSVSVKRHAPLFPGPDTVNCTGPSQISATKQAQQKNYLLAEFESILTRISKDKFI